MLHAHNPVLDLTISIPEVMLSEKEELQNGIADTEMLSKAFTEAVAAHRTLISQAVAEVEERFPDDVPRPPHWGGFMIVPQEIEFWADGEHRLHDRFRFTPDGKGGWDIQRLNP